ncbi:hypothetical protein DPX16_14415 [Anabarilius grahami]|uniref:Uncharacterized protein n=1 Tax=Anabarilius grahami TaxID=495550 RepID=A0A3N0XQC8_ANAGA|nr:hypothetical protein DPX16_14415 [Anabarilius grahami]
MVAARIMCEELRAEQSALRAPPDLPIIFKHVKKKKKKKDEDDSAWRIEKGGLLNFGRALYDDIQDDILQRIAQELQLSGLQVNQNPLELIVLSGVPLEVTCSITGTDNPNLYWYRWTPTDGLKLMFSSLGKGMVDPESMGDFSSKRPELLQILLESKSVTHIGSAVWDYLEFPHNTRHNQCIEQALAEEQDVAKAKQFQSLWLL